MSSDEPRYYLPPWARILLAGAAVVVIVAGMRAASSLLMPLFIATFVAIIASGPLFWLERKGLPQYLAIPLVVLAIVAVAAGLGTLLGTSVNDFTDKVPEYQAQLELERDSLFSWLESKGIDLPEKPLTRLVDPRAAMGMTANVLRGLGGLLTNTFLIILTVVFVLLEISTFSEKLEAATGVPARSFRGLARFTGSVRRYIAIKTIVSLATGVTVSLWLLLLGVDFPLLWGLLAFLLNYVPNLGSIIAAVPAVLVALIQFGLIKAVLVAAIYVGVNVVFGNIVEPRFMGKGLGLSTLVVFLSLVFWGWVFGPVGMLLSVLLTVMLKIALESSDATRWIAILMGEVAPPKEDSGGQSGAREAKEAGSA